MFKLIKYILFILIAIVLLLVFLDSDEESVKNVQELHEKTVTIEDIIDEMSLEQKIAQMMMIGFWKDDSVEEYASLIENDEIGNIIIMSSQFIINSNKRIGVIFCRKDFFCLHQVFVGLFLQGDCVMRFLWLFALDALQPLFRVRPRLGGHALSLDRSLAADSLPGRGGRRALQARKSAFRRLQAGRPIG